MDIFLYPIINKIDKIRDIQMAVHFVAKKWTVVALNMFCMGIAVTRMASMANQSYDSFNVSHSILIFNLMYISLIFEFNLKDSTAVNVWVNSGLSFVFNLVGVCGAYKEHYFMTLTYILSYMVLSVVHLILSATPLGVYFWLKTVLVCGLTLSYAYYLREIETLQLEAIKLYKGLPDMVFVDMRFVGRRMFLRIVALNLIDNYCPSYELPPIESPQFGNRLLESPPNKCRKRGRKTKRK